MPVSKVVLNASPLILLCNSKLSFVLPKLFSEIIVPAGVWNEILDGPYEDLAAQMLPSIDWIKKESVQSVSKVVQWDLGLGETEVLSFAVNHNNFIPVVDDLLAKKCARSLGLSTIGTGTILILAKEKGLVDSVEESLRMLQKQGLWITETIIQLLKKKAGEI